MNVHLHFHFDHNHDGLLTRIARDLGVAYDWLAGPGLSDQERLNRELAEARNGKYGVGAI